MEVEKPNLLYKRQQHNITIVNSIVGNNYFQFWNEMLKSNVIWANKQSIYKY